MSLPSIYQDSARPQPLAPVPAPSQFRWHQQELQIFIHFGVNTFTGKGWGDGKENPDLFAQTNLACDQWARVAKENANKIDSFWLDLAFKDEGYSISTFSLHLTSSIVKEAEGKKTGTREEKAI